MNQKTVRVLQYVRVLDSGGIEAFIFSYLRKFNLDKVKFDFLLTRNQKEFYDDQLDKFDSKKFCLDFKKSKIKVVNAFRKYKAFKNFLKIHPEYSVIHFESIGSDGFLDIIAAKKMGVKVRIAHSHIAADYKIGHKKGISKFFKMTMIKIKQSIIRYFVSKYATDFFACSKEAGEWMYSKKIQDKIIIVPNAIDTKEFHFSIEKRKQLRHQLKLENKYVYGHIGRFVYSKNHKFLLDVFAKVLTKKPNSVLILVGSGKLFEEIKDYSIKINIYDRCIFYGQTNRVNDIINVFDEFVFPSIYEGLGIVAVEAQTNGLPCLLSSTIPSEVKVLPDIKFLKLDQELWIKEMLNCPKRFDPEISYKKVECSDYNINISSKKLEDFYYSKR